MLDVGSTLHHRIILKVEDIFIDRWIDVSIGESCVGWWIALTRLTLGLLDRGDLAGDVALMVVGVAVFIVGVAVVLEVVVFVFARSTAAAVLAGVAATSGGRSRSAGLVGGRSRSAGLVGGRSRLAGLVGGLELVLVGSDRMDGSDISVAGVSPLAADATVEVLLVLVIVDTAGLSEAEASGSGGDTPGGDLPAGATAVSPPDSLAASLVASFMLVVPGGGVLVQGGGVVMPGGGVPVPCGGVLVPGGGVVVPDGGVVVPDGGVVLLGGGVMVPGGGVVA